MHNSFTDKPHTWWDPNGPFWTLHAINPLRTQFILKHIQEGQALDVGCGGGILSESLAQHFTVTGLDTDQNLINVAKKLKSRVTYHQTTSDQFKHTHAECFDLVTCLEVLEHTKDPKSIIADLSHMTKPGGYVVLSTINRNIASFLGAIVAAEHILNIIPKNTHHYEYFIQPEELVQWAREYGLSLIDMRGIIYNPLTQSFSLGHTTQINYIACFKRL